MNRTDLDDIFGEQGVLAQAIEGYQPRTQQIEMAKCIADTINEGGVLVAEAGTGTGKTFAYMVPSLLSGKKVLISTGTKNLQDQLFKKDIPTLRHALSRPFTTAILKGRSNYLCHHRLYMAKGEPASDYQYHQLQEIEEWSLTTDVGDLSETHLLDDQAALWPKVTSTIDNCLGQKCPEIDSCFVANARRNAQEADVVVINHHLLMSDIALKNNGQGEVLPEADAYIIDEAHQLPQIASVFLGQRVSTHQITELAQDSVREMEADAADSDRIRQYASKIENRLHQLRIEVGESDRRLPWHALQNENEHVHKKLILLIEAIETLATALEDLAERGRGLEQCHQRSQIIIERLNLFADNTSQDELIMWCDIRSNNLIFNATPYELNTVMERWFSRETASWVFTSATLTVAGKFNAFIQQMGLVDAQTQIWESPFDYRAQSMIYMPPIPVEPSNDSYNTYIAEVAKSVIESSQGRTFLLFTSYKAMHEVAQALKEMDYPLYVQGTDAKNNLLEAFRNHGNAVLLGTNSFWEGVDVKGDALSCVLIDKIPFASPGDPVLEAQINSLKERGGNPFRSIQIPAAVIQLKQGIGRLIRDEKDRGILVLCDPRFLTKPYGKTFMRSLPEMPITQMKDEVENFFNSMS